MVFGVLVEARVCLRTIQGSWMMEQKHCIGWPQNHHRVDLEGAFFFILLILCVLSSTQYIGHAQGQQFNVTDFGAVGDGKADDSQAFLSAWNESCETNGKSMPTMQVPAGKTFLVKQVKFAGPCKSSSVQIQGIT
ncbi:hypothetical protein SLEP1_g3157 [Rubroshorea leprosula]|uniref:Polygalacturonase n=1 Tax=Rubroshorea leprosula TaxID=152421 RepID=A0AAV5HT63_9ROSI|nr:hypothetical protein SLEP1_g3157 [Rubroshorea leprosula]